MLFHDRPLFSRLNVPLLTIVTFNQLQSKPLVCMASPLLFFWTVLQRNLLTCQVTPGSNSGSTSACPWLWSNGTLTAYWPVCKFDLILELSSCINQCSCLPIASLQWIAIVFQLFTFSISFIIFCMFFMLSLSYLCSIVSLLFLAILLLLVLFRWTSSVIFSQ